MANRMPSILALLGIAAYAGYQNRDKLSEMLADLQKGSQGQANNPDTTRQADQPQGEGNILGELSEMLQGGTAGSVIADGLKELTDRFQEAGQKQTSDSWVGTGANETTSPDTLEQVLGSDAIERLTAQTGLSRRELLQRLTIALPNTVDQFTPGGRLPDASEASRF